MRARLSSEDGKAGSALERKTWLAPGAGPGPVRDCTALQIRAVPTARRRRAALCRFLSGVNWPSSNSFLFPLLANCQLQATQRTCTRARAHPHEAPRVVGRLEHQEAEEAEVDNHCAVHEAPHGRVRSDEGAGGAL